MKPPDARAQCHPGPPEPSPPWTEPRDPADQKSSPPRLVRPDCHRCTESRVRGCATLFHVHTDSPEVHMRTRCQARSLRANGALCVRHARSISAGQRLGQEEGRPQSSERRCVSPPQKILKSGFVRCALKKKQNKKAPLLLEKNEMWVSSRRVGGRGHS